MNKARSFVAHKRKTKTRHLSVVVEYDIVEGTDEKMVGSFRPNRAKFLAPPRHFGQLNRYRFSLLMTTFETVF